MADSLTRRLESLGHSVERAADALRRRLKERSGGYGRVDLLPYVGDAGPGGLWLGGRVLEETGSREPRAADHVLHNVLASYRRFESDEVPDVEVVIEVGEMRQRVRTDGEGHFRLVVSFDPLANAPPDGSANGWMSAAFHVPPVPERGIEGARASGRARVVGTDADFGVISDLDDTVIRTGATSLLVMARLTLFGNAHTRLPFPGVAAFYRALEQGPEGTSHNPFFYVSSSPWNLYDLLEDFLALRGVPPGSMFLRDLGLGPHGLVGGGGHGEHKLARVDEIMARHPMLPFVLVGDSGQHDPEIYREVVRRHPGRIRAVYIRDVTEAGRDREVELLADDVRAHDVEMLLVPDSAAAAEHAASLGLISAGVLDPVRGERDRDAAGPDAVERAVEP